MNNKLADRPNHTPYDRPKHTGSKLLASGAAIMALTTGAAKLYSNNVASNEAQPACDFVVDTGDTVAGIAGKIRAGGDRVNSVFEVKSDGTRSTINPNVIRTGQTIEFDHVGATACQAAGGEVVLPPVNTVSTQTQPK